MVKLLEEEKNRSWHTVISPIAGCKYKCSYCYMHRIGADMTLQFDEEVLDTINEYNKPQRIFIGGAGDAWGKFINSKWIQCVLDCVEEKQCKHDFMFITKNPERYAEFKMPRHAWVGTTDDGTKMTKNNVECLRKSTTHNRFVSFEPLMEEPNEVNLKGINWVIIGADLTKGVPLPPKAWADKIINEARNKGIPVWINDSYKYPKIIKEFPTTFLTNTKKRFEVCIRNEEEVIYEDKIYRVRERIDCGMLHLSIGRKDGKCIHDWRELQKIKNEIAGCEREAVEIYPRESRVLDARNSFHLWVFDVGIKVPFGFDGRVVVDSGDRFNQRPFGIDESSVSMEEVIKRVVKG